ncbi:helicase-related protein [Ruegeria arenilitoris]|uniref:helicase-related protein n=1 Tax=Ruegeria arenilitoris TaxID=1173585 RepID=UPI001480BA18|nr:helicase-related protein [Ruegeria arenilitoris]
MAVDRSQDREIVASRLFDDLIGPRQSDEELSARPSDVYLTGILWPQCTAMGGEDDERLGTAGAGASEESSGENDAVKTRSIQKPSVAGISFSAASIGAPHVRVTCSFATYRLEEREENTIWKRQPHNIEISELLLEPGPTREISLRDLDQSLPSVSLSLRCLDVDGAVLATLALVNSAVPEQARDEIEASSLFQTAIRIEPCDGTRLVPKPPRRALTAGQNLEVNASEEVLSDEVSGALLYRNVLEFAVGHTCSAEWETLGGENDDQRSARWVETTWLPSAIVEGVDPNGHEYFSDLAKAANFDPMSAEELAHADSLSLQEGLNRFCGAYERWVKSQRKRIDDVDDVNPELKHVAVAHLAQCQVALERMQASVKELCSKPRLQRAFQLANLAMHLQHSWDETKSRHGPLRWRPFQLGFLLLSAPSSVERGHEHRGVLDLLWFPTGGGKTEAYLALIACIAVYRRLSDTPDDHSGVCALMRYTLRLLTTQQFARSAAMIVALEAIRTGKVTCPQGLPLQGDEPFSIGLWVGGDATPNKRTAAFASIVQRAQEIASPKQLARCPACGDKLEWSIASPTSPVLVQCTNSQCTMYGALPVFTVDEDVYDRRPTLLIGTVDKFAQIVREKRTNRLFGVSSGSPPDLIIQDELHLISGPLGTIAGTYETAFDLMFGSHGHRAKVIGSTATIRRAPEQALALFDRQAFQFPPPAIDHDDSGFAVRDQRRKAVGRRYLGVTTAGRSAKFTLQAVAGSLLQTAFGAFSDDDRRDAYWTLVGYFNSLRELGGALVLMQDDVSDSVELYSNARSEDARPLSNVEELTSRRTQEEIREMLDLLDIKVGSPGAVDAVLATNMVSVGVDISRLGLMLVNGQPKTIAEYIQSTSRVGRGDVSGLVVSVLNNAKARDRSHFETFSGWHRTLYRDVEATSVTPFASRARDRALHAALVAAVRHLVPDMLDSPRMDDDAEDEAMDIIDLIVGRAKKIDPEETAVRGELERLLDTWRARSPEIYWSDFKGGKSLLQSAERAAARRASGREAGAAWPTLNSMRTVEAGTPFRMAPVLRARDDMNEE